jgi:hypothetical protein
MSLETQHDPKNEAEITYWNSVGGRRWVERQQSPGIVLGPTLQGIRANKELKDAYESALPDAVRLRDYYGLNTETSNLARLVASTIGERPQISA